MEISSILSFPEYPLKIGQHAARELKQCKPSTVFAHTLSMPPIVAIVGRPNVGKSTLFNRLTQKRNALVDDIPGVTRDRLYATARWNDKDFVLVDTGGFDTAPADTLTDVIRKQVQIAVKEADVIILLFDGKTGPVLGDEDLLALLRRSKKKVLYAVNKIDGPKQEPLSLEFYALGIETVFPISSAHGYGVGSFMEQLMLDLPAGEDREEDEGRIRIAMIGRPNVGKSSLINRIIGSDRLVVGEMPGTTRDAVDILFEREGKRYQFIDTAGIRRKARVKERVEKFSIIKALNRCHIAVILFDALAGVYEQDMRICGYAFDRGCGMVRAFNKWDLVKGNPVLRKSLEDSIDRQLGFISFVPTIRISALTGERVNRLFTLIDAVWEQYNTHVPTPVINKAMDHIVAKNPPPRVGGKRLKLFYATQVSAQPPAFAIFVNSPDAVRPSFERYLLNQFREHFNLNLIALKIHFRER
jgi:GTP-binding protein